ncbi:MAG: protein phosphatase 2C domain-containing protein [Verrucomicrobiota bacterium]
MKQPSRVIWSGKTHPGHIRKKNEDTFLALTFNDKDFHYLGHKGHSDLNSADYVFAVSDGMGGANAGEYASKVAVEKITRWLPRGFRLRASGMEPGISDLFGELYEDIHQALSYLGQSYDECAGMGSTLSLIWLTPEWMYFAHIGDSRIYYLPATGPLRQLSEDHSHVGWLQRQGKISEREARTHPRRHAIQKALGAGHQYVEPQAGAVSLLPGDQFLICSDGVTDGLWNRNIEHLLHWPDAQERKFDPADRLIQKSLRISGQDNLTALVVEVC